MVINFGEVVKFQHRMQVIQQLDIVQYLKKNISVKIITSNCILEN